MGLLQINMCSKTVITPIVQNGKAEDKQNSSCVLLTQKAYNPLTTASDYQPTKYSVSRWDVECRMPLFILRKNLMRTLSFHLNSSLWTWYKTVIHSMLESDKTILYNGN